MSQNSIDVPSMLPLPAEVSEISKLVENQLTLGMGVIIIDRRQGMMIVHDGELQDAEVSADSLPFLLSTHSVEVIESKPSVEECLEELLKIEGTKCIFSSVGSELSSTVPVFESKIINDGGLLALIELEDARKLVSITKGA